LYDIEEQKRLDKIKKENAEKFGGDGSAQSILKKRM
jgi:hypothetical protein